MLNNNVLFVNKPRPDDASNLLLASVFYSTALTFKNMVAIQKKFSECLRDKIPVESISDLNRLVLDKIHFSGSGCSQENARVSCDSVELYIDRHTMNSSGCVIVVANMSGCDLNTKGYVIPDNSVCVIGKNLVFGCFAKTGAWRQ